VSKNFAIGQHVRTANGISVIRAARDPRYGGRYEIKPLRPTSLADSMPRWVQEWMIDELTEDNLCRRRTVENFCTCGCVHVDADYVIVQGR
jgi:hypothetical protein